MHFRRQRDILLTLQERRSRDIGRECAELGARIWQGLIDGGKGVIVIAVLLASDVGGGITGSLISIDGGTAPY